MTVQGAINQMRAWDVSYRQQLGEWDAKLGGIRRPHPRLGFADCTSTIQNTFLDNGLPNPGYFTGDMRTKGWMVANSRSGNFGDIRAGDILLMQWPSGTWHAELAVNNTTCIGHPGPGRGPWEKNLRAYLGAAAYWEARRHVTPGQSPNSNNTINKEETMIRKVFPVVSGKRIALKAGHDYKIPVNLASLGGPGVHTGEVFIDIFGLKPGGTVEAIPFLENAQTGKISSSYTARVVADNRGTIKTTVSLETNVPSGNRLFVRLRPITDCTLTAYGATVRRFN